MTTTANLESTKDDEPVNTPRLAHIRRRRIIALIGVLAVTAVLAGVFFKLHGDGLPDGAVLRTDGHVVSKAEYDDRISALAALYGVTQPTEAAEQDTFRRDAAKSVAVSMILDQAARDRGISISDQQAQTELSKLVDQQLPGGNDDFVDFLRNTSISQDQVLDEVRRQLETSRLFALITRDVPRVTAAETRQAYDSRPSQMVTHASRRISNIVVGSKAAAEELVQRVRAGAAFASLASRYSEDASTRGRGGNLGWMTRDQLDAKFADAAFQARPGEVFGPVQTQYGWNIAVVTGVRASRPLSFAAVRQQLSAELENERRLTSWRSWLASEIRNAGVVYADDYRPADPDAAPSDLPTGP